MTTTQKNVFAPERNSGFARNLENVLADLGNNSCLLRPEKLRERLKALDDLEKEFGNFVPDEFMKDPNAGIHRHARVLQSGLEAVNRKMYEAMRAELVRGAPPSKLLQWIKLSADADETVPRLAYDYRDEVMSGVLELREPSEARPHPSSEMVFYQPTPVRHILRLITASALSQRDVLVDLGSGLGHVVFLTAMLTGGLSIGIEVEPAYVSSAQECARRLRLRSAQFVCEDARTAELSRGTVFYLYSPFTGSILANVLDRLENESRRRRITVCALGHCTRTLATESWLRPIAIPESQQISIFHSFE